MIPPIVAGMVAIVVATPVLVSIEEITFPLTVRMDGFPTLTVNSPCQSVATIVRVSMVPVRFSKTQLPPSAAAPVASVDAATSSPVSAATVWMNWSPAMPDATLHP